MYRSVVCVGVVLLAWTTAAAAAGPAQVILIRHGEKPPEGNQLDLKGRERAAALAPYFQGTKEVLEFGTPVAIYAMGLKNEHTSHRPIATVTPLAETLKLKIVEQYTRDEFPKMVAEIQSKKEYEGKMVLISWEHHVIPDIARAFGAADAPKTWPGTAFDRTWILTFEKDGKPTFRNLPQKLLFGDSAE